MRLFAHLLACLSICSLWPTLALAQVESQPCHATTEKSIFFSDLKQADQLQVTVSGEDCNLATVEIIITHPSGEVLYSYQGDFIDHMPFIIYAPELNQLVQMFVNKVAQEATNRLTSNLPVYTNIEDFYDANNDFVIISLAQYEQLRKQAIPVLWHTTGNASWLHVIYDRKARASRIIMRGGIFQNHP